MQQFYLKKTHQQLKIQNMKRNVFIIYSPRHIKIEPASFRRVDTEIVFFFLPQNSRGFITSRFNGNKLKEVFDGEHRLWIEILNRSFVDNIVIKKNKPLGFVVVELEKLNFKHVLTKKKNKTKNEVCCSI